MSFGQELIKSMKGGQSYLKTGNLQDKRLTKNSMSIEYTNKGKWTVKMGDKIVYHGPSSYLAYLYFYS